ncbi:hypothetical protein V8G54_018859, partial [Vigna mungo]
VPVKNASIGGILGLNQLPQTLVLLFLLLLLLLLFLHNRIRNSSRGTTRSRLKPLKVITVYILRIVTEFLVESHDVAVPLPHAITRSLFVLKRDADVVVPNRHRLARIGFQEGFAVAAEDDFDHFLLQLSLLPRQLRLPFEALFVRVVLVEVVE